MKVTFNVYREDIPHPIPFWNKSKRFVLAYCREAFKKTGLRHIMRRA
jgi:hypothetical protein